MQDDILKNKIKKVSQLLIQYQRVLVAFSGGTDSTLLLAAAKRVLSDGVLAVTTVSETFTEQELTRARELANSLKAEHLAIYTQELSYPPFVDNNHQRCYHCKYLRLSELKKLAEKRSMIVVEGSNLDDSRVYRPGRKAANELGINSPLMEAGLDKAEVRAISKEWNLPTWNTPSQSCLATRIPYGQSITAHRLQRIARAEELLLTMGFDIVRVRDHGEIARIEVGRHEMNKLVNNSDYITSELQLMGFRYVTADLMGFRSGSMDV